MEDILTLWDGLFADGISLDLVDYVFLSLICNKRRKCKNHCYWKIANLFKTEFVAENFFLLSKSVLCTEKSELGMKLEYHKYGSSCRLSSVELITPDRTTRKTTNEFQCKKI